MTWILTATNTNTGELMHTTAEELPPHCPPWCPANVPPPQTEAVPDNPDDLPVNAPGYPKQSPQAE